MKFNDILNSLTNLAVQMKANMLFVAMLVFGLWAFHLINYLSGYRLNYLGIYPRHPIGLIGIPLAPLLHGNAEHLFLNSLPLFFLINFVLLSGYDVFYYVTLIIVALSGLGIWLFGRKAIHVGASSLVMGYWSYLLVNAYYQPSVMTIALGIVSIYYFGGLFLMLFPGKKEVSWEGHVFGFLAGVAAAYIV